MNNDYLINKQIKNNNVRISGEKELLTINKAIDLASSQGADLIQIAERDGVSICVVEELSKYIYQQKKKNKNNEKSKPKFIDYVNQKRIDGLIVLTIPSDGRLEGALSAIIEEKR